MKKLFVILFLLFQFSLSHATDFSDLDQLYGWDGSNQFYQTWADHKTQIGTYVATLGYAPALGEDDNYVTDAEKTVIVNTSGTNTGDQAASAVVFTPDGSIASTNVQDAIEEVRDEAGSGDAVNIALADAANNFTTDNVEAAFVEIIASIAAITGTTLAEVEAASFDWTAAHDFTGTSAPTLFGQISFEGEDVDDYDVFFSVTEPTGLYYIFVPGSYSSRIPAANSVDLTGKVVADGLAEGAVGPITVTKAANYTVGTDDPMECYGATIHVTSAATITACDGLAERMNFSVITRAAVAVSTDVQSDDRMVLDGVALDDGDKATNTSTIGDLLYCEYESVAGWYCISSGVDGDHHTDGGQ